MMNELIIEQKMSNSGSIHDLASQHYDRVIALKSNIKYIVILPAYFGDVYTLHSTAKGAIKGYRVLTTEGYEPHILDRQGESLYLEDLETEIR